VTLTTSGPDSRRSSNAGTEVIEFSPTKELQQTLEVVEKNMAEAG
jgi:hypothetical protein